MSRSDFDPRVFVGPEPVTWFPMIEEPDPHSDRSRRVEPTRRVRCDVVHLPAAVAPLAAMNSGAGQLQRHEERIELANRTAAHERDGAAERALQVRESRHQPFGHDDFVGPAREFEKRSVYVEE